MEEPIEQNEDPPVDNIVVLAHHPAVDKIPEKEAGEEFGVSESGRMLRVAGLFQR